MRTNSLEVTISWRADFSHNVVFYRRAIRKESGTPIASMIEIGVQRSGPLKLSR
jgi:hypothetical protein